jgi:hypothetical protein
MRKEVSDIQHLQWSSIQDAPACQLNSDSVLPLAGYMDETSLSLVMLIMKRSKSKKRCARIWTLGTNARGFWYFCVVQNRTKDARPMLTIKEDRRLLQGTYIKSNRRIRTWCCGLCKYEHKYTVNSFDAQLFSLRLAAALCALGTFVDSVLVWVGIIEQM